MTRGSSTMYDVAVAGGGPAGLCAATEAARRGCRVALVEKSRAFGHPVHDSGGMFHQDLSHYGLGEEVISNKIRGASIVSPGNKIYSADFGENIGYILERRELNRRLAEIAASSGVGIHLHETATSPIIDGERVAGFASISGAQEINYEALVTIDASGVAGALSRKLGLHPGLMSIDRAIGYQYELANVKMDRDDFIELYFGSKAAGNGYAWIFPKGDGRAYAGVGLISRDGRFGRTNGRRVLDYFIHKHPVASKRLGGASPIEFHSGVFPVGPMFETSVRDGFLAVGDAACQGSPHLGEGIRFVMHAGHIAGEIASGAVERGDSSVRSLTKFNERVRKEVYIDYNLLYRIFKYATAKDDEAWEKTIEKLGRIIETPNGKKALAKVVSGSVTKSDLLKYGLEFSMFNFKRLFG